MHASTMVHELPPVSALLRISDDQRRSTSSGGSSPSPPTSPRTPRGGASPTAFAPIQGEGGKRRARPPPLNLPGAVPLARGSSDERRSISALVNGPPSSASAALPTPSLTTPGLPSAGLPSAGLHTPGYGPPPPDYAHHHAAHHGHGHPQSAHSPAHAHAPHPPRPSTDYRPMSDYRPPTSDYRPRSHERLNYRPEFARRHTYHPAVEYPQHPGYYPYEYGPAYFSGPGMPVAPIMVGLPFDPTGLGTRMPISRTTKACDACRARKVRCDAGGMPGQTGHCSRCRESGRVCQYSATQKKRGPCPGRPARAPPTSAGAQSSSASGQQTQQPPATAPASAQQHATEPPASAPPGTITRRGSFEAPRDRWDVQRVPRSAPHTDYYWPPDDRYHPYRPPRMAGSWDERDYAQHAQQQQAGPHAHPYPPAHASVPGPHQQQPQHPGQHGQPQRPPPHPQQHQPQPHQQHAPPPPPGTSGSHASHPSHPSHQNYDAAHSPRHAQMFHPGYSLRASGPEQWSERRDYFEGPHGEYRRRTASPPPHAQHRLAPIRGD